MRIAIAVAGLLLLSGCGGDYDNGKPEHVVQGENGVVLTFGNIEEVHGTRFFTIPVVRTGDSGSDSYKSRGNNERNRLIVDSLSGESRRVLPDDTYELVNWVVPRMRASDTEYSSSSDDSGAPSDKPVDTYAAVVKRPGKNDAKATYDVLLGHFEDGRQVWVARGLAGVQGVWLTPDHKIAMVIAANNRGLYRLYDPASFAQLLQKNLEL